MRESSGCAARSFHALTEILISPPAASIAACTEGRSKDQKRALIRHHRRGGEELRRHGGRDPVEILESSRDNKAKGGVMFSER